MALNKESNGYVLMFSTILVLATSILLVVVFGFTKDTIANNQKLEKMQNILQAANIQIERDLAEPEFNKTVIDAFALTETGEVKMKGDLDYVFNINLAVEINKKAGEEKHFPVFVCSKNDSTFYVLGMRGKGLWDAIWGYAAIESDMQTVYNAVFDHKSETAGLGAEINQSWFTKTFIGKKLTNEAGEFVSISVAKKGSYPQGSLNHVDGISGGTLTSDGLHDMLKMFFSAFHAFGQTHAAEQPATVLESNTDSLNIDSIPAETADTLNQLSTSNS